MPITKNASCGNANKDLPKKVRIEAGKLWDFLDLEFLTFFQLLFKNLYLVGLFTKLKKNHLSLTISTYFLEKIHDYIIFILNTQWDRGISHFFWDGFSKKGQNQSHIPYFSGLYLKFKHRSIK